MVLVTLPTRPGPAMVAWEPVDFGGTMPGALGGTAQRQNRLGNRWSVTVTMPVMAMDDARAWAAALTRGLRNGVSWTIRQVGTPTGSPGAVLVAGAAQAGDLLDLDGFTSGYPVKAGQWLSLLTGGQRYLYQAAGNVRAVAGAATVAIEPPLRVEPADNDPVEIGRPVIEGLLGAPQGWSIDADRLARGFQFTISETR